MKITISRQKIETVEIEVEFPIYCEHNHGDNDYDSITYTKVECIPDKSGSYALLATSLHWNENFVTRREEWEVSTERWEMRGDEDYMLGKGQYALSEAQWLQACANMRAWMIRRGVF